MKTNPFIGQRLFRHLHLREHGALRRLHGKRLQAAIDRDVFILRGERHPWITLHFLDSVKQHSDDPFWIWRDSLSRAGRTFTRNAGDNTSAPLERQIGIHPIQQHRDFAAEPDEK